MNADRNNPLDRDEETRADNISGGQSSQHRDPEARGGHRHTDEGVSGDVNPNHPGSHPDRDRDRNPDRTSDSHREDSHRSEGDRNRHENPDQRHHQGSREGSGDAEHIKRDQEDDYRDQRGH